MRAVCHVADGEKSALAVACLCVVVMSSGSSSKYTSDNI